VADNHFPLRNRPQERSADRHSARDIQYLLRAEGQILQSISGQAPLPEVLHKICDSLNLEIGNTISHFSLSNDGATGLATVARSAALFGLHKFCSARVVAGNGELLGSLEMYSCVPRRPFAPEVLLIERATCLAAIAIKRDTDARDHDHDAPHRAFTCPVSRN